MTLNDAMIELSELWSGEYDDIKVMPLVPYGFSERTPRITWLIELESTTEYGDSHKADFTTRLWRFEAEVIHEALDDALEFARDLKALAPEDGE